MKTRARYPKKNQKEKNPTDSDALVRILPATERRAKEKPHGPNACRQSGISRRDGRRQTHTNTEAQCAP